MSLLDRYVDTVAGLIVDHGGMVDKIVGDAVHAFFNAPLDLPQHAERGVACACAIVEATEALRRETLASPMALGRTRIGIETGQAVLGDVGRGAKRDYTAYGSVVNLASRLEEANKHFGSSILLGPGTVVALAGKHLSAELARSPLRGLPMRSRFSSRFTGESDLLPHLSHRFFDLGFAPFFDGTGGITRMGNVGAFATR